MAEALEIKIDSSKFEAYIGGVIRKLPERFGNMGWNIAQIEASSIRQEANSVFSKGFPRPLLSTTIRPVVLEEKKRYAVKADAKNEEGKEYWFYVERGRRPGRNPPVGPTFREWARKAGRNPYGLSKAIGDKGTKGTHFVRNGRIKAQPKVDSFIRRESRRLIE